jgi:tryptophan-rich sensory protein
MVGGEAARFTVPNVAAWYATLVRPPLALAVAAWLVWRGPAVGRRSQSALVVWGCQLAVNALWTPVFFGLRLIAPGLAVILVLFGAVGLTTASFWRVNRAAGMLFIPYLAWVGFAAYLNAGFWWLNHG